MKENTQPKREDVLNAFAVELNRDSRTLQHYLKEYPQFAVEIAALSHELSRKIEKRPISQKDRDAIDSAWKNHALAISVRPVDVFTSIPVPKLREAAKALGIPLQVLAGFKEHKVIPSSIPGRFLERLSAAINRTTEEITAAIAFSNDPVLARSNKSDQKPKPVVPVSFEQLLIDAQVSPEKRAELMADDR
jgi:hypothetical protein